MVDHELYSVEIWRSLFEFILRLDTNEQKNRNKKKNQMWYFALAGEGILVAVYSLLSIYLLFFPIYNFHYF